MTVDIKLNLADKRIGVNGSSINLENSVFDAEVREYDEGKGRAVKIMYKRPRINKKEGRRLWNFLMNYSNNTGEESSIHMMSEDYETYGEEYGSEIMFWGDINPKIIR